jgi:hypothetical protein
MGVGQLTVLVVEDTARAHISVAALLQVGLEEEALRLAAFGLLLALDLVQRELQGADGGEPGLEQCELDSGGRSRRLKFLHLFRRRQREPGLDR